MANPLQPQFKIRVFNGKKINLDTLKGTGITASSEGDYIDVEYCTAYPVVYKEEASLLNTLSFSIDKYGDILLYYFFIGQAVSLYGGYYTETSTGMRHVFSGSVTRVRTSFLDSGRIVVTVECMSYSYTKLGRDKKSFVYPDFLSGRNFAKKSSLKLQDIIKGIASDNNIQLGDVELSPEANKVTFTNKAIRYQKEVSDWNFLNQLAEDFGCTMWISSTNGEERLNFVSKTKAFEKQTSDLGFIFPLQGAITDIKDYEVQTFPNSEYNRPRILRSLEVDEDVSAANAVSRSAMYFDKTTGEYKEAVSLIEQDKDGKTSITFYELDEQKVAYVSENFPDIAKKIRDSSPTSLPWGTPDNPNCSSYYYTKVQKYDAQTAVFDKAFYGITVTGKVNQDLDIRSQRTYPIRGILSYHSRDINSSFFLRGLSHIWDSDGTWTELDFIR